MHQDQACKHFGTGFAPCSFTGQLVRPLDFLEAHDLGVELDRPFQVFYDAAQVRHLTQR